MDISEKRYGWPATRPLIEGGWIVLARKNDGKQTGEWTNVWPTAKPKEGEPEGIFLDGKAAKEFAHAMADRPNVEVLLVKIAPEKTFPPTCG